MPRPHPLTPAPDGAPLDRGTGRPFTPGSFTWLLGIEDTCVYPRPGFGMNPLDELALTGHREDWRADLESASALGAQAIRYGADWPLVATAPGVYDWSSLDERVAYAHSLGLSIVADLVHYGTPEWLDGSFADPSYPEAVADFAAAYAAHFAGVADHVTPFNEPLTTASFCGMRGVWPPGLSGWEGWVKVVVNICDGIQRSVRRVRSANPDAVIVHVEASSLYSAGSPDLEAEASWLNRLGMLPTDLVLGRVTPGSRNYRWLCEHGADVAQLHRLADDGVDLDIMGVNYYPDLSPRLLQPTEDGSRQIATNAWAEGLEESLRRFAGRYGLPMVVTETSIEGSDDLRSSWISASIERIGSLVDQGMDIRGWTWWPLTDFVDWSYASGGRNVEEFAIPDDVVDRRTAADGLDPYLRRMGLVRLEEGPDHRMARVPTPAADRYHDVASTSDPHDDATAALPQGS